MIKFEDFDLGNTKYMKNNTKIFQFIKHTKKTLIGAKPLRVRFDKINGFIKSYDGNRYLVLFRGEKYDFIYNRIRYVIGVKSGSTHVISHNYAKIKVDSYDSSDSFIFAPRKNIDFA